MTGNELARQIRRTKGPLFVTMIIPNDVAYVQAIKADLVDWAESIGDQEIRMGLDKRDNGTYLDVCYSE